MLEAQIDPEEFPFTEAELRTALALIFDDERAARESAEHAEALRREVAARAAYRVRIAVARPDSARTVPADGSAVPVISHPIYHWYPAEALALLHLVSDDMALRVNAHRVTRSMADRHRSTRQAVRRATGRESVPAPPAVAAQLVAEEIASEQQWLRMIRKMQRRIKAGRRT